MSEWVVLLKGQRKPERFSADTLDEANGTLDFGNTDGGFVASYGIQEIQGYYEDAAIQTVAIEDIKGAWQEKFVWTVSVRGKSMTFEFPAHSVTQEKERLIFREQDGRVVGNFEFKSVRGHRKRSSIAVVLPAPSCKSEPEIIDLASLQ